MAFWGTVITRQSPYIHGAHGHSKRLRITQASLGLINTDNILKEKKVVVLCTQGKVNQFRLCVLIPEKVESTSLATELDVNEDVEISVIGSRKVSLCGYFLDGHDRFAAKKHIFDTEGENIQDSKNEGSDDSEDDDYDDFIDDMDLDDDSHSPNQKLKYSGSGKRKSTRRLFCREGEVNSNKHEKTINSLVKPNAKPKAGWKQLTPKFDL